MTGIGRLRALAYKKNFLEPAEARELDAIADQIEREQRGRVSRMRVLSVVTEMERHVSGAEGMEDSPVARWARELREALGGDGRDHAADVSVSAYDLLPEEDREAIAWVREHGGIDYVKKEWRSRVPYDRYERRRQRLLGHIAECETALGRRREIISKLTHHVKALANENVELRRRAMPEGMEWMVEAWPRFEDDAPVRLLDDFERYGEESGVSAVTMYQDGSFALNCRAYSKGERVNRPAPKVLDADGVEIRVGDRVWSTQLDEPHEWIVINPHEDRGYAQTVLVSIGDRTGHARPENLTHRAPVLASDGEPLEVGQTVYATRYGYVKCTVLAIEWDVDGYLVEVENEGGCKFRQTPDEFIHQRPVLAADGEPLEVGQTVWHVSNGIKFTVVGLINQGERQVVKLRLSDDGSFTALNPDQLTHHRPDTWQRIEEDATLGPEVYCHRNGIDISQKDGTEIFLADTVEPMARDLVLRCRALAERERGE